jgi:hypothetical protein
MSWRQNQPKRGPILCLSKLVHSGLQQFSKSSPKYVNNHPMGEIWHVFKNYKSRQKFWATFFHEICKLCISFDQKIGWATFWAIFSKTHLVALFPCQTINLVNAFHTKMFSLPL